MGKTMRQISRRTVLIIIAGTIISLLLLLLDVLKVVVTNIFPPLPPWVILVSIVVVIVLATAVSLWYERLKSTPETLAAAARENRQRMLKLVQNQWITGFLENPLYYSYSHDEQLLPLPLREHVGSHFDLVLSDPLKSSRSISSGTTIMQVFDQAKGELLILGEPGAGKTTLLLELACDLLKRAKDNEAAPIPVVLMLASWATEKLPLEQWIVEELRMKYDVPSQIGKEWVNANLLLLLLDGLDEVTPDALPACIEAINGYYHQAHRSLVVCSRMKEFLDQPGRLALHTAVTVQPLSSEQIGTYLDGLAAKGEEIEGLKHALHQSATLRVLATTPLFLIVLILAYHGKPEHELRALVKAAPTDQPHLLFHNYVEQMLQRKGTRIHAPAQQTKHWLMWLAHQLTAHQQSELYLERLQPDWLPKRQRTFYRWSIWLLFGLIGGLIGGLVVGLIAGLGLGLGNWLIGGLVVGLRYGRNPKIEPVEALTWRWEGLGVGRVAELLLVGGPSRKQLTERSILSPNEGIRRSVKNGLLFWLLYGLFFGLGATGWALLCNTIPYASGSGARTSFPGRQCLSSMMPWSNYSCAKSVAGTSFGIVCCKTTLPH
jgi:DNA polymerase III delta prime subunit